MRRLRPYLAALAAALWLLAGPAHAGTPPPPSASGAGTPLAPPASGAHTPLAPSASGAGTPVPPLATEGGRIVDARGRTALLQGVNWFGFETAAHVVHGLWTRDYRDVLSQIRAAGFNTIRLPFSLEALDADATTGIDFSGGKNGPLRGRTPLQDLDTIVEAAAREHLMVLLDNHSAADDAYQQPLWYGDAGYTEDDWVTAWRRLAARYAGQPNVIGADLKNEPHGPATWGTGGATDWRRAAERAGSAIAAVAPHWLIVVEGIEGHVRGQRLGGHWWGGNLEGVRRAPVRLPLPHRLVYSPHEYGPGVFPQPWFQAPRVAEVLERRWRTGFGFLVEQGIAPVLVGEWGGREVGLDTVEGRWQRQLMDYLARTGISWTYWALNPDSGDTGGVLRDDWTSLDMGKARLLRQLIRREPVPFGARAGAGAGASDPAPSTTAEPTPRPTGPGACIACGAPPESGPRTTPAVPPAHLGMRTIEPPGVPATPAPGGARPAARSGPPAPDAARGGAVRLVIDTRWEAGWCGHAEVTPRARMALAARTLRFDLPVGTNVTQSWNAERRSGGGVVTLRLPGWADAAPGAPYTATGVCVAGSDSPEQVVLR